MKTGRFLLWSLGTFALLCAAYVWAYRAALRQPVWPHDWLRNVYLAKERIARDAPAPRWLILGGSSALFGFDSGVLARATGQSVVNLGMHAEVPADFQCWQAEKHVRAGDTVLLVEEMAYFRRERPTTYASTQIALMAPEYFDAASWRQKRDLLRATPPSRVLAGLIAWAARGSAGYERNLRLPSAEQLWTNLRARWAGTYAGEIPGYYNYLELDPHGDLVRPRTAAEHRHETYDLLDPLPSEVSACQVLEKFATKMRGRGVRCLFSWQPFERHPAFSLETPIVRANLEQIRRRLTAAGWQEVGRPDDFLFDPGQFYDTAYHLTTEGARQRTIRLVDRLREARLVPAGPRDEPLR